MADPIRLQVIHALKAALETLGVTLMDMPTYEAGVEADPPALAVYFGGHEVDYPANGVASYRLRLDLVVLERAQGQGTFAEIGPALNRQLAERHAQIVRALHAAPDLWELISELREVGAGDPEPLSDRGIAPVAEWPLAFELLFETAADDPGSPA